ncbi:hypothetical protein [Thermoanaerobacterium sp. DL9XJH110]|uniref:hypothetical protein n=1 Tax=Thermoanaerobacterium sp. DL9XJH110 TaxID=3386643 RepID=UPI003BB7F509
MFPIPWYVAAFESIPEAFLIIILALKIMDEKEVNYRQILLASIIYGFITFFVRNITVRFEQHFLASLHTIILILALALLFSLLCRKKFRACFMPVFVVSVLYGLIQHVIILSIFIMLHLKADVFEQYPWLTVILFIPVAGITFWIVHLYANSSRGM